MTTTFGQFPHRYVMLEKLSEADKNRTHIFSSFFYKRLTQREYGRHVTNPELSAIEKRHNRVRKWTRNVDLFEKDFIVIPINERFVHFFTIFFNFFKFIFIVDLCYTCVLTLCLVYSVCLLCFHFKIIFYQPVLLQN